MRFVASFALSIVAGAGFLSSATASGDPLAPHRWKDRVLVVVSPGIGDARLADQRRIVRAARRGMGERDLAVVEGTGDDALAATLRRRFRVDRDAFAAILIGKDGGEKLRSPLPLAADQIFEVVDRMPMRRDEMRRRAPSAGE